MNEYKPMPKGAKAVLYYYKNGVTDINELSDLTKLATTTVKGYLNIYNPKNPRTINYKNRKISKKTYNIIEMLKRGVQQSMIAQKNNVSRQCVSIVKYKFLEGGNYD
jgi:hypothetical protein